MQMTKSEAVSPARRRFDPHCSQWPKMAVCECVYMSQQLCKHLLVITHRKWLFGQATVWIYRVGSRSPFLIHFIGWILLGCGPQLNMVARVHLWNNIPKIDLHFLQDCIKRERRPRSTKPLGRLIRFNWGILRVRPQQRINFIIHFQKRDLSFPH